MIEKLGISVSWKSKGNRLLVYESCSSGYPQYQIANRWQKVVEFEVRRRWWYIDR